MLACPARSVGAVLLERAVCAADHGPVATQPMLDRNHREIYPSSGGGTVDFVQVRRAQQDSAGFVHTRPRCPDLLQMPSHAVVAVVRIMGERLRREVSEKLTDQSCRGSIVQQ
jgi:hypothetical protein